MEQHLTQRAPCRRSRGRAGNASHVQNKSEKRTFEEIDPPIAAMAMKVAIHRDHIYARARSAGEAAFFAALREIALRGIGDFRDFDRRHEIPVLDRWSLDNPDRRLGVALVEWRNRLLRQLREKPEHTFEEPRKPACRHHRTLPSPDRGWLTPGCRSDGGVASTGILSRSISGISP